MNEKTYNLKVAGMHCKACELWIESELGDLPNIKAAKASLGSNELVVTGEFGGRSPEEVAKELNEVVSKQGYSLSIGGTAPAKNWADFKVAVPVALGFALLFVALQKVGLVNLVGGDTTSYGTSFLVGIIASLSTCMAVVGGLVLSVSATFAKEGDRVRPQVLFHVGRLVAFFVLGGAIGAIGSAFALGVKGTFLLGLLAGLVMLVLGINLLDVFRFAKRFQLSMPKFLGNRALSVSKWNHRATPVALGVATFFLPCGFTQSMQIYTLTTGSFLSGGLTMLVFALGTLPVLALLSFSSFSVKSSPKAGVFYKSAGLIVIMFALFNIINSFAVIGLIPPIFSF